MQPGTIIILNGASSSGKSTLLHLLQERLDEPYLDFGLDKLIWMLPKRYFAQPLWDEVLGKADQAGQYGHQLVHAMHRAIRSLAENGLNILVDHVLIEPGWVIDCAGQMGDLNAYLIGLKCDLSILEMREKHRKDMTLGQARAQFGKVHEHVSYDFLVD
jgi:chloramphenicol 3-O-phosphotransferase